MATIVNSVGSSSSTGTSSPDSSRVDVRDYGAVADYVVATGVGTDNTTAIQAAIQAASGGTHWGKVVYIPPGRYKTTAPLVLHQGIELAGPDRALYGTNIGSQGPTGMAVIDFHGAGTANCIEATFEDEANSKACVRDLAIVDRRTTPTSGDGIFYEGVVNGTKVERCFVFGFPTGASIRFTGASGSSTDCISISDVWVLGSQHGIYLNNLDNEVLIRDVKCDNTDGVTQSVVRVGNSTQAAVIIDGVKHESGGTNPTILLEGNNRAVSITGVVSRIGTGGPVVRCTDNGIGVTIRGITRPNSGDLVDVQGSTTPYTITGTRLAWWVGGTDPVHFNQAFLRGGSSTGDNDRIYTSGKLVVSNVTPAGGDDGKLFVQRDSTSQKALVVYGGASATVDLARFHDSTGTAFRIEADGRTQLSRAFSTTKRTAVADANYTILTTDYYVPVTSLTAPRTITLPSVASVGTGHLVIVKDEAGAAGTHNLTVTRAGANLIDGATTAVIAVNYGVLRLISTGTNWSVI